MKPNISEFSYGYALTDELIHWHGTAITAAPVFPSLYQEGKPGGGYDVKLQRPGLPLFLQFKLSHCMVRNNAQEVIHGLLATPYYRMHLRPARHSDQHEMLLDLENAGQHVYYCAPTFHTPTELNDAYLLHHVRNRSLWLKPSAIGPLPDDEDHYVAFQIPGTTHFCSEPRKLEAGGDFEEFTMAVEGSYRQERKLALRRENLTYLADAITEISEKRRDISPEAKRASHAELAARHPLDRIAFYASVFMDCQLFIVSEREEENGQ